MIWPVGRSLFFHEKPRGKHLAPFLVALLVSASIALQTNAQPSLPNDCDGWLNEAQAALQGEKPQQAEAAIRSSAPSCQQMVRASALLGASLDEQGKHAEAQRIFLHAIAQNPEWASLHDNLGLSYLHSGKNEEAVAQFREAIRLDPQDRLAILNLAQGLIGEREYQKAFDLLTKNVSNAASDPEWYAVLTEAYLGAGQRKQALEAAERAVGIGGEDPGIDFSLGLLFARYNQDEQAIDYFTRIPPANRDFATDFDLGLSYLHLGKLDKASTMFVDASKIDPNAVEPYLELAEIDVDKNAPGEALGVLVKAHQIAPARVDVTAELVDLLINTERLNDAQELLTQEVHQHPASALLKKAQGDLYNRQDLDRQAINAYQASLKIDPKLTDSQIGLARVFQRMGQNAEARANYVQVLRVVPTCGAANAGIGTIELQDGHAAQAISYLKASLLEEPSDIDTGKALANAYMKTKDYERAVETLSHLEAIDPNNSQIHYLKGQALLKLNRKTEAQEEFHKAQSVLNTPLAQPIRPLWLASAGCSVAPANTLRRLNNK